MVCTFLWLPFALAYACMKPIFVTADFDSPRATFDTPRAFAYFRKKFAAASVM